MDARGIRPSMTDGEMWTPALQEMRMGARSAELRDGNETRFARSAAPRGCSRLGRGVRAWTGPAEASAGAPAPNVSLLGILAFWHACGDLFVEKSSWLVILLLN